MTIPLETWKVFLDRYYIGAIISLEYPDQRSLYIDFINIEKFDDALATALLNNPLDALPALQDALKTFELPRNIKLDDAHIRLRHVPNLIKIRDIRSEHIGKLIAIDGLVRVVADVRPTLTVGMFKCQGCNEVIPLPQSPQTFDMFTEPYICPNEGCGRQRAFKLLVDESEFVDAHKIRVQESPEDLRGGEQPQTLDIALEDDIAGIVSPGDHVTLVGVLRSYQRITRTGRSTTFDILLDANSIELHDKEFTEVEITPDDEKKIIELSKDPEIYAKIIQSIAPSIYGYAEVKEGLALQLMGGVSKNLPDGTRIRGDVHILLVGDPGIAKSQLLKYVTKLAPRGIYTSGRSSSAVGLTASAVKNDLSGGDGRWTLEAGALVLGDHGIVAIDELDKMRPEDRSALHESAEQQSYHPSTEIMFSDGYRVLIGEFVDTLLKKNPDKVKYGVDCEILPLDTIPNFDKPNILTLKSDNTLYHTPITQVSRHKAPSHLIKITYSNGRTIIVTPEHPIFSMRNGDITTIRADKVECGMYAPIPTNYPLSNSIIPLKTPDMRQNHGDRCYKPISFPSHLDRDLSRLLGYIISEGHTYYSTKNGVAEIMIPNTNPAITNDADTIFQKTFNTTTCTQHRTFDRTDHPRKDLYVVRCVSQPLYHFMRLNFIGATLKSHEKRIPDQIFASNDDIKKEFLIGVFRGDGFYDSERFGYITNSIGLANDYSDLLLCLGIFSYVTISDNYTVKGVVKTMYKVVISGQDSQKKFYDFIAAYDIRNKTILKFVTRSFNKRNDRDTVPVDIAIRIEKLLKDYKISDGYFYKIIKNKNGVHRKTAQHHLNKVEMYLNTLHPHDLDNTLHPREIRKNYRITFDTIAKQMGLSVSMISYIERNSSTKNANRLLCQLRHLAKTKIKATEKEIKSLKELIESDIRFTTVKSVSIIKDHDLDWVYDVTVDPTHTFVSNGLILHNTVTVTKAGIQTTLKSRCAILAAANPKYGRFDPYEGIAPQIAVAPALLSRFDLIFILKDEPNTALDTAIANHILNAHYAGGLNAQHTQSPTSNPTETQINTAMDIVMPIIPPDLLRLYTAYAKKNVFPIVPADVRARLRDFYLSLRKQGEDRDAPIPATARQLEALERLCEASARLRLSETATIEDAERTIRVTKSCLKQVAFDQETGMFDTDLITGVSKTQRDKFKKLREIIQEIADTNHGEAPVEMVVAAANVHGLDEEHVLDMLQRLITQGELYSPKKGTYRLVT